MEEFEVVTGFYSIVPWLSSGFLILGLVMAIAIAVIIGWRAGIQTRRNKKIKLWLAFGWLPIFGLLALSIAASSFVYYESKDQLSKQITLNSGIDVITFVRNDEHRFIGKKDEKVFVCRVSEQSIDTFYQVICR